ncbi:MAG: peptide chain release factor N(5)-glutamine methyltransferase [Pseudobacteriovorax sp.]|nr:peptide chain release factor N(5)-glutamine methyltransferase [Pseudobacteriovorax sp.]
MQKVWTIKEVGDWSKRFLEGKSESHRLDSDLLLADALNCSRLELYCNFDKPVSSVEREKLKSSLQKRAQGIPVAYILGEKEFFGYRFSVNPKVLIPRPETEHLVEESIAVLKRIGDGENRVLDVGTGSGCIAIAIKKTLPNCIVEGVDVSEEALSIAIENSKKLDAEVKFNRANAFSINAGAQYDMICTNPPYVSRKAVSDGSLSKAVADFEPELALFAEDDGLKFYIEFARNYKRLLKPGGFLLAEIGFDQADEVKSIFESQGWSDIRMVADYSGHERVIVVKNPVN